MCIQKGIVQYKYTSILYCALYLLFLFSFGFFFFFDVNIIIQSDPECRGEYAMLHTENAQVS